MLEKLLYSHSLEYSKFFQVLFSRLYNSSYLFLIGIPDSVVLKFEHDVCLQQFTQLKFLEAWQKIARK